jgi:hypothetical protein
MPKAFRLPKSRIAICPIRDEEHWSRDYRKENCEYASELKFPRQIDHAVYVDCGK